MKSIAITSLAFVNASLKANLEQFNNRTDTNPSLRAFKGNVATAFDPIKGYGCWCYLDDSWRDPSKAAINRPSISAHGIPVDPIDEACRNLINSYKCVEMDAEAENIDNCDAQAVEYTPFNVFEAGVPFNQLSTVLEADCVSRNQDKNICAKNACIVEGAFTINFISFIFGAQEITDHPNFNPDYVHISNGGTFDPEVECPGIPNPVGSEKECCGSFVDLSRHPYRLFSGFTTRSCCSGEVINNEINSCCNGIILDVGESCP